MNLYNAIYGCHPRRNAEIHFVSDDTDDDRQRKKHNKKRR